MKNEGDKMTDREYLKDVAKRILLPSVADAADRFYNRKDYITTDQVGYKLTEMEALLRPLWGIAPLLKEDDLTVSQDGVYVSVGALYRDIMLKGTGDHGDFLFSKYSSIKTFVYSLLYKPVR